ncbi:SH3 domain-containing protein [Aureisphaera galaxeae]|uniref:SH3 domain-containing protein n=1 Tax=Aureisphaera galaxeae TaxID=1538023 RepID=UPI002350D186|nr:SH3 domain-containing protein [Aureisphaera galaxeae]MDC8006075.1 SH3 domain-containing protein [Aureisphaera galaxeae]
MKKLVFILCCISGLSFGQEAKYLSQSFEFKSGETAYLFGDQVKLREAPNTASEVLALLGIGEAIEILEKTDSHMTYEGMKSPWYKVKYKEKVGFVLGGLISMDKATYRDQTYLVALKEDKGTFYLKTRVMGKEEGYIENVSALYTHAFSIKAYGNRGLQDLEGIFLVNYISESCGVDGGGIYLFHTGNSLLEAIRFSRVADADLYWFIEEYIFPFDESGKRNKILYKREEGSTLEYETEWKETKIIQRLLEWKDNQVLPKIDFKEN